MSTKVDIAIIGGGLNGLVTGAYLAKTGRSVTIFEQSDSVGGTMSTVEIGPGFRGPAALDSIDLVHPSIIEDLNLRQNGLRMIRGGGLILASSSGRGLYLDSASSLSDQIASFSQIDEKAFLELDAFLARIGKALDPVLTRPLKNPKTDGLSGAFDLMKVGWALRKLGQREMPEALRFLPMTVQDVLDERFESEYLKAMIAATALKGSWLAPRSAGSAYGLLHHNPHWAKGLNRTTIFAEGGPGALSDAVAAAARSAGASIRTDARVTKIIVEAGLCTGLTLESGEHIQADRIISALDPRTTFESLTGQDWLDPDFMERVRQIRSHGSVAIVRLALDRAPQFTCAPEGSESISGRIQIGDSLQYIEKAFDAAKYGQIPDAPLLMASIPSIMDPTLAPTGKHVMIIWAATMPSQLREGNWDDEKEALGDRIVGILDQHAPGLRASVVHRQVETPADLQKRFGLTNGCIYHVDLALDQLLYMRPIPGWFRYDTPIERLHLCGAGVHPGGAGTGLSGKCAAEHIARL
ncbi:MAG: NAD(P)/FAD-dependent oxidoreductase [Bacteroidetes bacterium]|nr:MAG: NAD(P)/FAD-dependent oxidoreductase [Bacteroidota bacterium]